MGEFTKAFSDNLKKRRKEKKLTQEELAKCAGVSTKTISAWEGYGRGNDEIHPDLENAAAAAKCLDTSLDYLCGLSKSPEIGKERQVTNLGGIIKMILQIANYVPTYADTIERNWSEEERTYNNEEGNPYPTTKSKVLQIVIDDERIADSLSIYSQLKHLYEEGAINDSLFDKLSDTTLAETDKFPIRQLPRRAGLLSLDDVPPTLRDPDRPTMRELLCGSK